jgi:hypothetical protein
MIDRATDGMHGHHDITTHRVNALPLKTQRHLISDTAPSRLPALPCANFVLNLSPRLGGAFFATSPTSLKNPRYLPNSDIVSMRLPASFRVKSYDWARFVLAGLFLLPNTSRKNLRKRPVNKQRATNKACANSNQSGGKLDLNASKGTHSEIRYSHKQDPSAADVGRRTQDVPT